MVILSIADMHIVRDNAQFSTSLENFTRTLRELWGNDGFWKPDFLCICGDIVNKGNIDLFGEMKNSGDTGYAGEAIRKIANAAGLQDRYIMMVPGNHDLHTKDIAEKGSYIERTAQWLANNNTRIPHEALNALTPYAAFRRKFLVSGQQYIDPGLGNLNQSLQQVFLPQELIDATGCRVFEREKIIFIELNSSWCDIGGNFRYIMLHRVYIDNLFHKIQRYKQKGYYIVALFHHSLRHLSPDQYAETDRTNLYDQIVDMADLCLTGHDHGYRSKEPDKLANKCQQILNSGFFSVNNPSKIYDSGATLIKIERYNEILYTLKLWREADNKWQVDKLHKLYSTANQHIDPSIITNGEKAQIPYSLQIRPETYHGRLNDRIITRLFGSCNYSELPVAKKIPWRHFKVHKDGFETYIMVLDATTYPIRPLHDSILNNIEHESLSLVVFIYDDRKDMQRNSLSELKKILKSKIFRGKVAIIPATLKI